MRLPTGAQQIIRVRQSGKRPADMVLVSNIGKLPGENPQIITEGTGFDWRWLTGLDFCMFGEINDALMENLEDICKAAKGYLPSRLLIWDTKHETGIYAWYLPKAETIHLPKTRWEWEFSFIPWTDWQNQNFKEMQCN